MVTKTAQSLGESRVAGRDHSAFTGGDVLDRMTAEHGHIGNAAYATPSILSSEGVTRILNHRQSVALRYLPDRIQIGGMSRIIHRKNGSRPRRNSRLYLIGIQIECVRRNVGKNRMRALIQNTVCRGGEGQGSRDGFVARLESRGKSSRVQSCSTGTEADRMGGADSRRKGFFELTDL